MRTHWLADAPIPNDGGSPKRFRREYLARRRLLTLLRGVSAQLSMQAFGPTIPFLASIAALCSLALPLEAQTYTWTSPVSGDWSNSANWLGGIAPPPGGSSTLSIKFAPSYSPTNLYADNDLAGDFLLNALELNVPNSSTLHVGSSPEVFRFSGVNSRITLNGHGSFEFNKPFFDTADGVTTVDGTGSGGIRIFSLEGLSAGDTLRIATGPDSPYGQIVRVRVNATGGTVQMDSGNLSIDYWPQNANTNFRINGGTLRLSSDSPPPIINSPIQLGASLVMLEPKNATITSAITSITPSAGLQLRTSQDTLTLSGASTYMGPTVVDTNVGNGGTLRLAGNGSILNTSELDVRHGNLAIETVPTGVTNRVGDSTPVFLRGGRLTIEVPTAGTGVQSERVGPVSLSGSSIISAGLFVSRSVDLTAASLTRLQRGTVVFRSPTLATLGPNPARILFTAAPTLVGGGGTGANTSIIPYAVGDAGGSIGGGGFVTYTPATGVRLLDTATEYVSSLAEATSTSNVRITGSASLAADTAINSLFLAQDSPGIGGTSMLTINSGAILVTRTATIGPAINFGSAEGQIFAGGNIVFQRPISGSNGITKSGFATVTFEAANPFSGPLTINEGTVGFNAMDQLGADPSAIIVSGGASLRYTGPGTLIFNRPIETLSGYATFDSTAELADLTKPISGPGGLRLAGAIRLSAINTHEGGTHFQSRGTLEFANDSALGSGEFVIGSTSFPRPKIQLLGDWTTSRIVRLADGAIDLNTNGYNAIFNGQLVTDSNSLVRLTKLGAGTLALNNVTNRVAFNINEGTVILNQQASAYGVSVSGGASLVVDETGTYGGRLAWDPLAPVDLFGGTVRMIGDPTIPASERIVTLKFGVDTKNTIELIRPGAASVRFAVTQLQQNSAELIVKADGLGDPATLPNTRLIFETPPATSTGILPRIYATPTSGTGQESLTKYASGSDSAGLIGVKPLAGADYTSGPVLQHSDGTANFLVQGAASASGPNNSVKTLTFEPGSTLTQSSGQALELKDQMLVRSGAPSRLSGGSLQASTLMAFGEIAIDATIVGPMTKYGPGTLVLGAQSALQVELTSLRSYGLHANALTITGTLDLSLDLAYDPADFVDAFNILNVGTLTLAPGAPVELFSYMGNPLSEGEKFYVGTQLFRITYLDGDGNDATIVPIPEPSAGLAAALAVCSILGLRRRARCRQGVFK